MDAQPTKPQSAPHPAAAAPRDVAGSNSSSASQSRTERVGRRDPSSRLSSSVDDAGPRKPSSAGVVSRVLVDVVASRRDAQRQRHGGDNSLLASRESMFTAAASLHSSSALSVKSVCRLERELGRSLPVHTAGTHVTLSAADLTKVHDAETLKFLEQHSTLFVKYFNETSDATGGPVSRSGSNAGGDVKGRFQPVDAAEMAAHVKALVEEIDTFITAVDLEGTQYRVAVDGNGELHVPVDFLGGGGGEGDSVANMDDFTDADLAAFNEEFGIDDDYDDDDETNGVADDSSAADADKSDVWDASMQDAVKNPFDDGAEVDRDSQCSDVLMGSMASTVSPEDALRQRFDDHRRLLGVTGEHGLQKRLELVVAHHKGQRPRFMQPTKAQQAKGETIPPSPPPGSGNAGGISEPRKRSGGFGVQYCGRRVGGGGAPSATTSAGTIQALLPPRVAPKPQMAKLNPDEEARVRFLLETENWETATMDQEADDAPQASSASSASSAAPSSIGTGLTYDRRSAATYAPASGGYKPAAAVEKRLKTIDEQLAMMQKVREETNVSVPSMASVQCSVSRPRGGLVPSSSASAAPSVAPSTKEAEEALLASEKRKQLGDGYLQRVREDKQVRQRLSELNDKLRDISSTMDHICTPPFSFQLGYDMEKDPKQWVWPDALPKPSEDTIRSLLVEAEREQRSVERQRGLCALPGSSEEEKVATAGLSNAFTQNPRPLSSNSRDGDATVVVNEADAPPPAASYFHEQLRERMQRALTLAREAEHAAYRADQPEAALEDEPEEGDGASLETVAISST